MTPTQPTATTTEALRRLTERTENFWAFIQGEYGVRLSSADQDDHNVFEFFSALEDANAALEAALSAPSGDGVPGIVQDDVAELVIAARIVAFEDQSQEALDRLDKASEPFSEIVPWDEDPANLETIS